MHKPLFILFPNDIFFYKCHRTIPGYLQDKKNVKVIGIFYLRMMK